MSVILEFSVEDDAFQLGRVLSPPPDMHIEVERIVPLGNKMMPFLWVTGGDLPAFEAKVRDHPTVDDLTPLDKVGDKALYRIEWKDSPTDLVAAIADAGASVLEAQGNDTWVFRIRFPDHARLSQFHNAIIELDVPIHIERTYTLTEQTQSGQQFGLTEEQREALVLALQRGYFTTPKGVGLDELADELEISRQALSKRIRRGNEAILQKVLLASATDLE